LLFPPCCMNCDADLNIHDRQTMLCTDCRDRLGLETWHGCPRCGGQIEPSEADVEGCIRCRRKRLQFDAVVALGNYHEGLRKTILFMKRPKHHALSMAFGRMLAQQRQGHLSLLNADVIVPIPMFWTRRLFRGKNNPEILAGCLAKHLEIPMHRNILVRCKNTSPQAGLRPNQRILNVRGAFQVRRPELVKNARVLLVDDVLTTGATCDEAAKMLKQAGASMVAVAVVARA
jgi:ComF family protein